MSLFDWFDELKCQHEYKYVDQCEGYNFLGIHIIRKYYQCTKCLKTKYVDFEVEG